MYASKGFWLFLNLVFQTLKGDYNSYKPPTCSASGFNYEQSPYFISFVSLKHLLFLSVLVRIGGMLGVMLGIKDYRRLQTVTHPNKFTLALAEKLYGLEQMAAATVTGKDCNRQLDPQITLAFKSEVLRILGSSLSSEEQTKLWNGCIASVRFERKFSLLTDHARRKKKPVEARLITTFFMDCFLGSFIIWRCFVIVA